MKVRGMSVYSRAMPLTTSVAHVLEVEKRHHGGGSGGALRAAVFGMNDGLVSNTALIMGVAGAAVDHATVLLSGMAGLLAGAFSMASGEYISVRSQRELFEYQIGLEKEELDEYPEAEAAELAMIYEAKGLSKEEAHGIAHALIKDPERALDTLAREELGLNPDDLGSPWQAAFSSFVAFAVGAAVPLFPFWLAGGHPVTFTALFSGLTLFLVGLLLSLFTGRHALWSGLRMLLIGAAAAGATYLIGTWLGVHVA
jgi:VIT1/CCC1 family predicted Fe2+/Mn2+ transporter